MRQAQYSKIELGCVPGHTMIDRSEMADQLAKHLTSNYCHWIFQWHSFRPGIDSASSDNEYQEHFLGVKVTGAWGWQTHHLHVPNVMEIWENKPSGTLWATLGLLRDSFTFTPTYRTWACPGNICKGCQGSDQGLGEKEARGILAVQSWNKTG